VAGDEERLGEVSWSRALLGEERLGGVVRDALRAAEVSSGDSNSDPVLDTVTRRSVLDGLELLAVASADPRVSW
jgi:hypothetical protein